MEESSSLYRERDDQIDLSELARRLRQGVFRIAGLALLGLAIAAIVAVVTASRQQTVTSLRASFSFPGFERGTYPNGGKFVPDDLRAPDVITEAIKRLGLPEQLASQIRGSISINGFISPTIIKERDRLRASGMQPQPYFPDEYEITLSLPRDFTVEMRQRELLLSEIVTVYREKFSRSYVELPPHFGSAFSSLNDADFVEYELILTREVQSLSGYLQQQVEKAHEFRSPTTNLSIQDLLRLTDIFSQVRLNNVLGLIYVNGLSKDRTFALVKMDYHLRTLEDQEQRLREEENVVNGLLTRTQERMQNYVLATKAENLTSKTGQPLLDQSFIDTLLANDAYNFLVRKSLDAGLAVRRIQSEKTQLQERRQRMEKFQSTDSVGQASVIARTQTALAQLERDYFDLLKTVRITLLDYGRQEYGDAVRITLQATTPSAINSVLTWSAVGLAIGASLGFGLALLNGAPQRRAG